MQPMRYSLKQLSLLLLTCTAFVLGAGSAFADEGETDISPADAIESDEPANNASATDPSSSDEPTQITQPAKKADPARKSAKTKGSSKKAKNEPDAEVEKTNDSEPGSVPGKESEASETAAPEPAPPEPFVMLDSEVPPGETRRLSWIASESFSGISVPTPVLVSHGVKTGPVLCLTAAIHGDELNGIEMVRRVLYGLDPQKLSGTVVGVPIVNLFGFRRSSRYLPDRRDLNRYFPGDPKGSSASRIAYAFFESIIKKCDYLVDLHTGSFHRTNLPQLRADLTNPEILRLTQGFGATAVLRSKGQAGTLRRAANDAGVPTVTLEAGEPTRFQPEEVAHGVKGIRTLLNKLGMLKRVSLWGDPQPIYYASDWIRADTGGILFSRVSLGDEVEKGQLLGTVTDPITNNRSEIRASARGRILGMALNQVVIPGFASFRIGIEKSPDEVAKEAANVAAEQETLSEPEVPAAEADASTEIPEANGVEGKDETPRASKDGVDEERPD